MCNLEDGNHVFVLFFLVIKEQYKMSYLYKWMTNSKMYTYFVKKCDYLVTIFGISIPKLVRN